jgi:ABC-type branched-subunit amino acid transport system ATPase component
MTILFTEQNTRQSLPISHRGDILENGRVAIAGEARKPLADDRLHRINMDLQPGDRAMHVVASAA